jgi:hypothetical protein
MVDVPSILKAKLLLSGVKETSNVEAPIPLLSMHVANEFDPITRTALAESMSDRTTRVNIKKTEAKED